MIIKGGYTIFISMKNKKLTTILTLLIGLIFTYSGFTNFKAQAWKQFFLSLLGISSLFVPFIISHISIKKKLELPPNFILIFVLFIFSAQYLGEIIRFYDKFWWWDLLLHGFSGGYFVVVGFYLRKNVIKASSTITLKRFTFFTVCWSFSFSMLIGTLWEIFEFVGDYLLKTSMTGGSLNDTMTDLIIKAIGCLITSTIYYYKSLIGKL
jgi:hypothetical protein